MPVPHARRCAGAILFALSILTRVWSGSTARAEDWADQRPEGPFHCHADFRLDPYQPLLDDLANLQTDLVHALAVPSTHEPVELYLFAYQAAYVRYLKSRYPQAPYRRALFIKDRGPGEVFAQVSPDFEIDLRHEATHALLHGSLPMVPLWLDEGLAKYFEVPREHRVNGSPYMSTVKENVRLGQLFKLPVLEQKRDVREMGVPEYRYSWAWVHFLLNGPPEARDELTAYLRDIRDHKESDRLSARLSRRLPNLDAQIARHFLEWETAR